MAAASRRRRKIGSAPSDGIFGRSADDGLTHATLIFDAAGNLYGTTGCDGLNHASTVFKLTKSGNGWTSTVLHTFDLASDGSDPTAITIDSDGTLYGATNSGGPYDVGTLWMIKP